ncbi:DUF6134 family protein [Dyadobacter frigoris]|uniref:DUF3108 domain-containing protein n=1 Tax=Dyadobacter frigoris TaxID=2576211 RepID=A0A4U6D4A4_9BACT|nr:DUF6134 family protein [Dyadobacter frigoris]TKT88794.1 hypothetical protein FDK13_26200 [Dyadobacter frigoris]GLU53991.1 hypothetical protein Dfri01_34520 [Dyadobacter frigoris]
MKYLALLIIAAGLLLPLISVSQTVMYDVMVAGRVIGSVKVLLYENTSKTIKHRIEAQFSIPFYSGSFSSENDFLEGNLQSSVTEHFVNGKQKESTRTSNRHPQLYHVSFSGKATDYGKLKELNQTINHTMTGLYYQEPSNVGMVYSERYGQMCPVKKLDESRYGVVLPNGKQSIYAYRQGLCTEVQSELAGMKLRIVRRWNQLAVK